MGLIREANDSQSRVAASLTTPSLLALHEALSSADRVSRQTRRYEFDLLRALAALTVFTCHFFGLAGALPEAWVEWNAIGHFCLHFGSFGTDALIFISGFFIAKSMGQESYSYRNFLRQKMGIIYGPYIAVLVVATLVSVVAPGLSKFEEGVNPAAYLVHQLLLLPGLFPEAPMLSVSWTLAFIVAGYLACPLWHLPVRYGSVWKKAAYWLVSVLLLGAIAAQLEMSGRCLLAPAGVAAFYVAKALASKIVGVFLPRVMLAGAAALLILRGYAIVQGWTLDAFTILAIELGALLLLAGSILSSEGREEPTALKPLAGIGRSGYSFYLLHGSITKIVLLLLFPGSGYAISAPSDLVMSFGLAMAAALIGSQILYQLVEKPLRNGLMLTPEVVLSDAEQRQVIESLQPRTPSRYSREDSRYR